MGKRLEFCGPHSVSLDQHPQGAFELKSIGLPGSIGTANRAHEDRVLVFDRDAELGRAIDAEQSTGLLVDREREAVSDGDNFARFRHGPRYSAGLTFEEVVA